VIPSIQFQWTWECSDDVGKSRVKGSTTQQINKQGAKEETKNFHHAKI
jgi:hypothetical protein